MDPLTSLGSIYSLLDGIYTKLGDIKELKGDGAETSNVLRSAMQAIDMYHAEYLFVALEAIRESADNLLQAVSSAEAKSRVTLFFKAGKIRMDLKDGMTKLSMTIGTLTATLAAHNVQLTAATLGELRIVHNELLTVKLGMLATKQQQAVGIANEAARIAHERRRTGSSSPSGGDQQMVITLCQQLPDDLKGSVQDPVELEVAIQELRVLCGQLAEEKLEQENVYIQQIIGALSQLQTNATNIRLDITRADDEGAKPPTYFLCPISMQLMTDPVMTTAGSTYERSAIATWLQTHDRDPLTQKHLDSKQLTPVYALRHAIEDWRAKKNVTVTTAVHISSSQQSTSEHRGYARQQGDIMPEGVDIQSTIRLVNSDSANGKVHSTARTEKNLMSGSKCDQSGLAQAGGFASLIDLLHQGDAAGKSDAARALAAYALHNQHSQDCMLQAGAIPLLVHLLTNGDANGKSNAARALRSLAYLSKDNVVSIAQAGAIPPLVCLLESGDAVGKGTAAGALWMLAANNEYNRVTIAQAGGIPPLIRLLHSGYTKAKAAGALAQLAVNDSNKVSIAQAGAIPPLICLVDSGDTKGQESAARALEYLAHNNDSNKVNIVEAGGIPPLIKLLNNGDADGKACAAAVLWTLAVNNDNNKVLIAQAGGIPPLIRLVGGGAAEGKACAAAALWSLAADGSNSVSIAQAGGIPPLIRLLNSGNAEGKSNAAGALWNLAINSSSNRGAIAHAGAIPPLTLLYNSGNTEGKRHAAGALRTLRVPGW